MHPLRCPTLSQQQEKKIIYLHPNGQERAPRRRRLGGEESNIDGSNVVVLLFVFLNLDLCSLLRLQRPLGYQLDRIR